jgi:hypothetical protein
MIPWQWAPAILQVLAHAHALSLSLATCYLGWTYDSADVTGYPSRATVVVTGLARRSCRGVVQRLGHRPLQTLQLKGCS